MPPRGVAPDPSPTRYSLAFACTVTIAMLGSLLAPCACNPPANTSDPSVAEQTVAYSVGATVAALPQLPSRTPASSSPTPCTDPSADALSRFLALMQRWVAEERAITDAWNALAYGPEGSGMPPEEKTKALDALAAQIGVVWYAVAEIPAPDECAAVRDQYVLALRKHHRFYLLTKSYVETQDEHYRTLANEEREEATRLRREVWGMLGDLEYWLEQHPCPGSHTPWPGLEGGASV